jgi:hypothetical protein
MHILTHEVTLFSFFASVLPKLLEGWAFFPNFTGFPRLRRIDLPKGLDSSDLIY